MSFLFGEDADEEAAAASAKGRARMCCAMPSLLLDEE
jgi:hypothetical protein